MTNGSDSTTGPNAGRIQLTTEEFVQKLRAALRTDGDFPASAKIVSELRMLTSDPRTTANQITEVILREPSLGTRVLHLVNSSYYRRVKAIMTVSQAVVQIGMKPLADLCAGLVLLQKFVPLARRGGAFASCLQKTVLTSLLSSSLASQSKLEGTQTNSKADECGFLAGSFAEMGTLLLAYYFPQVYESAIKRAETKHLDLEHSLTEIVGLTPLELSIEVLGALDMPQFYRELMLCAASKPSFDVSKVAPTKEQIEIIKVARAVQAARDISAAIVTSKNRQTLDTTLNKVKTTLNLQNRTVETIIGELPDAFKRQCESIELSLPSLPSYVATYLIQTPETPDITSSDPDSDEFMQYVEEIRQAVEDGESTASVITTVMETFAWNLKFDRVLLLLLTSGKRKLSGRMLLGKTADMDPKKIERNVEGPETTHAPDAAACNEGRPIYHGDPILENGWPLVAMPIGFGHRCIGVIYADRLSPNDLELNAREQAAISVLAELLDRSVGMNN